MFNASGVERFRQLGDEPHDFFRGTAHAATEEMLNAILNLIGLKLRAVGTEPQCLCTVES